MAACCCAEKPDSFGPCNGPIEEYYSNGHFSGFCDAHFAKFPSSAAWNVDVFGKRYPITKRLYVSGYRPHCVSRERDGDACNGETDEYYCTDGSLIALCAFHLGQCRAVVYDDGKPITKRYYEEVYDKD